MVAALPAATAHRNLEAAERAAELAGRVASVAGLAVLPERRMGIVMQANSDAGSAPSTPWSNSG